MKTIKIFAIALVTLLAFSKAEAQVRVNAYIGAPVYHQVYARPYPARIVEVNRPVYYHHYDDRPVYHPDFDRRVYYHRYNDRPVYHRWYRRPVEYRRY